ncbi:MAG TPA: GNAT family N-acetyltransferase, partial [Burkholderiaceae bacterium]|nr:GNAT family N-acetyltransferase [Burkholderiaceae bacterium]
MLTLRAARADEHAALTALARRAKAHWGYPADALARWHDELTVTRASIESLPTAVAERDGAVVGFFQLRLDGPDATLEHLWVLPEQIGHGIGRTLLQRALDDTRAAGHGRLCIDADPHAEAFYRACGAERVGEVAAPIEC